MKALSVRQPHAEQIASGTKTIELRSIRTHHRGPLLIVSSKTGPDREHPKGVAVCIVSVIDCRPFEPEDAAAAMSDWRPGLFAWILQGARRVEAVPVTGSLSLFNVEWPSGRRLSAQ